MCVWERKHLKRKSFTFNGHLVTIMFVYEHLADLAYFGRCVLQVII